MADTHDGGVIRWENPPEAALLQGNRRPWALVAAQLRQKPGEWALIDDQSNFSVATRISRGKTTWFRPQGAFEATMRIIDGRIHTWARYVGEDHSR